MFLLQEFSLVWWEKRGFYGGFAYYSPDFRNENGALIKNKRRDFCGFRVNVNARLACAALVFGQIPEKQRYGFRMFLVWVRCALTPVACDIYGAEWLTYGAETGLRKCGKKLP